MPERGQPGDVFVVHRCAQILAYTEQERQQTLAAARADIRKDTAAPASLSPAQIDVILRRIRIR